MSKKIEGDKELKIQFAAWLFVNKTRDAKEIAKTVNVGERTIHRYAETDTWNNTLQTLKYEGKRNFRVRQAGSEKALYRKIYMAENFLDSAQLLEATTNFVSADSQEDAEARLAENTLRRKTVTHFLYAMVIEISIKVIWEIEKGNTPEYNHDIWSRYTELSLDSRYKISDLYETQVANINTIVTRCNRQKDNGGRIVNITLDLQSLEDALKANEQTVINFKYDGKFEGKSSALCSVMRTDSLIYALPRSIANAIIFPRQLLDYVISLNR